MIQAKSILAISLLLGLSIAARADEQGLSETSQRFDYHTVRGRQSISTATGVYEGEAHLTLQGKSRVQGMRHYGEGWSGGAHLLWDGVVGESMQTAFRLEQGGRFRLSMQLTKAPDYGLFSLRLNGKEIGKEIDLYAPRVELAERLELGEVALQAGDQKLEFALTGANPRAKKFRDQGYLLGLDYLKLVEVDPPSDPPSKSAQRKPEKDDLALGARIGFEQMKPLMAQYCYRCHGGAEPEGEINLRKLASKADFLANISLTRKVAGALQRREMPPKDAKQPPRAQQQQLASLFHSLVDEYVQSSSSLAPVVMRRLNRYEYNNAVRDLLKLKGDIYPLPEKVLRADTPYFDPASGRFPDTVLVGNRTLGKNQIEKQILTGVSPFAIDLQAEHGFNNRGEELSVSPILLESFLKLGKAIVESPEFDGYCGLTDSLFKAPEHVSPDRQVEIGAERLRGFLERAFRGRVDEATEKRYVDFLARELARTESFSRSMKQVVAAILASPRFLYLTEQTQQSEPKPRASGVGCEQTGYELATRLSFFLWSSIPDDELLKLARTGELLEPEVLEAQVRRMLADPRSQALSENFARQWLRLDQIVTAVPDFERFPIYYSRIGCEQWKFGLQMMVEPLLLFESIMVEDRSIMLLVDSNYAYRSDELQSWYLDKQPFQNRENRNRFDTFQQRFRRRKLDTRRQGGVITSAAVLTMTSAPLRTRPITRGAWVATAIFNRPPPPPPDVIPPIEADDAAIEAKGLTLRERLKQHQVNPSCVSCHSKIDPLGFALENFDALGRWRDRYRSGLPIDAGGELFGKASFTDVVGLKDAILDQPEWFMRAFSEHLLSYALGRQLQVSDEPAVDRIVQNVMADHGQFSTVVRQIAASYPFLHKTGP